MALQTDTVTLKSALPTTTFETSKELLRYPLKEDDAYAGRIRFEVFTATPIDPTVDAAKIRAGSVAASKNKQIAIVEGSPTEEGAFDYYADQRRQLQLNQATVQFGAEFGSAEAIEERKQLEDAIAEVRAANNSLFKGFSYDKDLESSVVDLHFPLAVIFNDNINYSDAGIGVIGASALAASQNTGSVTQALEDAISTSFKTLFDFQASELGEDVGRLALSRLAARAPSQDLRNAASLALGVTVNPNTRTLFTGVGIRQFSFQFKFIPTSQAESIIVEKIIRHLREQAYPEVFDVGDENLPIGYKFPKVFKISFKHRKQVAKIPKLEFCYLRQVQHVYNPTGPSFHVDGRPNEVDVTLLFSEIRALNRKDIQRGA